MFVLLSFNDRFVLSAFVFGLVFLWKIMSESQDIFSEESQEVPVPKKVVKRPRKQSIQWTKEDAKRLVMAVECEQCLWDHTAAVYKDRDKRELAWANIANITGQPAEECLKKWNSLRVNYRVN